MDENFSIQLKIVDRHFPYSCKRKDEQILRKAATGVTNKYMAYSSYYSGPNFPMVDVLKLVAFHFSLELQENKQQADMVPVIGKIEQLNTELERYIQAL